MFDPIRSLYFHFPFCETKCHYCDFYSIGAEKTKTSDASVFENALIAEIDLRGKNHEFASSLDTIFLGGGTPSMTPPDSMKRIFEALFQYTSVTPDTEWTMEANPSSIELQQFREYRKIGINRVSMGVQSLQDDHLKLLGRVHDSESAFRALDSVFEAGFTNVSTDLLCGVPGQTLAHLENHMRALSARPITHLSCYLLTLAPHHKLFSQLPNDDEQLAHLLLIDSLMKQKGFQHYEISNFCRPGFEAKHNLVYWKDQPYLGLGPSAHSFVGLNDQSFQRFKNTSSLHAYARKLIDEKTLATEWVETLTPDQRNIEKWMLAIRLSEGFPEKWLKTDRLKQKAASLMQEGLLEIHPSIASQIRATPKGFALSDSVIKEFVRASA